MEHIVQFAISIDDNSIQEIVKEKAAEQIAEEIKKAANGVGYYSGKVNQKPEVLKEMFMESVDRVVKENKEQIIDKAVAELIKGLKNTKRVKELLAKLESEE